VPSRLRRFGKQPILFDKQRFAHTALPDPIPMKYLRATRFTILFSLLVASAFLPSAVKSSSTNQRNGTPTGGVATPAASSPAQSALNNLQEASRAEIVAQVSPQTLNYNFVRTQTGGVLVTADKSATPQARALAFLAEHGGLVGMNDAERAALSTGAAPREGSDLRIAKTETDSIGMTHVRFNQFYQGLPVFGAQTIVHMNAEGIIAVNGDYIPTITVSTIPAMSEGDAIQAALLTVRKQSGSDDLKPGKTEMAVYPAGLLAGGSVLSRLAYGIEVSGKDANEQIWVDAQNGVILGRIPRHHTALNRTIYSPQYDEANPDLFVQRKEGDPPHPTPFVNNLYDFAGQTYNLYASGFGRDSYDAAGHKMISVYLINQQCPNAYWNGTSTNYCPIFDADDVVSHEWSHAYTEYTHGLIYAYQSGALNESYSDIFGETVDLLNNADGQGGNNNAQPYPAGQRWLVGEDLGQEVQELLLRDMYDPDRLAAPGKVSSINYACGNSDGGGVHTNSGVPNHAYALIVDGTQFKPAVPEIGQAAGTYNGQTVAGIGLTKAAAIYYRAESVYQVPTTTFAQHDTALQQSCKDLTGAQLKGLSTTNATGANSGEVITAADCQQVAKAMLAVEMSLTPPCNTGPVLDSAPAQLCAGAGVIFSEDWETGEDGWTKTSMGFGTGLVDWEDASKAATRFFKLVTNLPEGRTGSAAFADDPKTGEPGGGTCGPGGDYSGSHSIDSPTITIPAGATAPLLVFDHWMASEAGVDGGQVEISRNGGAFTLLPKSQYVFNPPNNVYNQASPVGNNTNPNPNEDAYTGFNIGVPNVGSWGTTVANLASVAQPGDTIKIRFLWSQDGCNGVVGWYVDNIKVVACPLLATPVLSTGSDYENPDTNGSFTLSWTRPAGASGPDVLQVSETSCAPLVFDNAESGLANWTTSSTGTGAQAWKTSNLKPQHNSNTFNVQGTPGITNADSYLTYKNPITIPAAGQTFLNFLDWDSNEGEDNVLVEVSENDGATWIAAYTHNRSESGTGPASFASEPLFQRSVNLANFGGKTIRLRFRYSLGPEDRPASAPLGWYVDDISLVNDSWVDVATTTGTSLVQARESGTYCYRVRTTYTLAGQSVASPFSNVVSVVVSPGINLPATLQNISTRLRVLPGDNTMIAGIIISGTTPKKVILRGMGPSLVTNTTPVVGRLTDPTLALHAQSGALIASNDNWKEGTQRAEIEASGIPPGDDREAAIVAILAPGQYTAVLRGKNDEVGIGVVEAYDLNLADTSKLGNISSRGFVQAADDAMIGGFIAGPGTRGSTAVLIRGMGPSVPVTPNLADPTLQLVNANGTTIDENDNWKEDQQAAIVATGIPPGNDSEAAILVPALAPGQYTAVLRGVNNTIGNGLVEIYNLR
jgi:Zn-dependent metalloprotease